MDIEDYQYSSSGYKTSLSTDSLGNVYMVGKFVTGDFDPGPGTYLLTSAGMENAFIQKMDSQGNFAWAGSITGLKSRATCVDADAFGNIHVAGSYDGDSDFDPGEGTFVKSGTDYYDAYLLKLSQCNPSQGTDVVSACNSCTWIDGATYTESNHTATHVLINEGGCDSTVSLDLTINYPTTGTDVVSACNSYTWIDGATYTESNHTATHVLINEGGCDSTVSLDLTINYPTTGTDVIEACESYTWIDGITYAESNNTATHILTNEVGCDSLVALQLTIAYPTYITDEITACDSITWIDGTTYTESNNTATHTLTGAAGCDSTVLLDLTVISVDASITVSGTTVAAVLAGAEYRWIDCINFNAVIEGEIDQSFTPTASGSYAVEVTKDVCAKTSACVPITVEEVGVEEDPIFREVSIFPNPTKGLVNIELGSLSDVSIIVYDMDGRVIYRQERIQGTGTQIKLQAEPSLYLIEVIVLEKKKLYKLIIE